MAGEVGPPPQVSAELVKQLLGPWKGQWGDSFVSFTLTIKSIEGDKAEALYEWSPSGFSRTREAGSSLLSGTFDGRVLYFQIERKDARTGAPAGRGEFWFSMKPDGTLECKYRSPSSLSSAIAKKAE